MRALLVIGFISLCVGCAHTHGPFVQAGIRIVPPVEQQHDQGDIVIHAFNDGGTKCITITDAAGQKFDVYIDHRLDTKTPGAIYLIDYPGKSDSVRIVDEQDFKKKIGDFK